MSEEDAIIQTILASPNDAVARLVYADWLEDRADSRSEYLRLLCRLDGLADDDPCAEDLNKRLQQLHRRIDLVWVGLMNRGRKRIHPLRAEGASSTARVRRRRHEALEADIGLFLKQYARKRHKGYDPNDRSYSRIIEAKVKRMRPEELDRLMRGEQ